MILLLGLVACGGKRPETKKNLAPANDSPPGKPVNVTNDDAEKRSGYQETPFGLVKNYPLIKDSAGFISALKRNCHFYEDYMLSQGEELTETINIFSQIKIFGGKKTYYLVEYDWHGAGPMVTYPWKIQYLFDAGGKLVNYFYGIYAKPVTIFPGQPPFLMILRSSSRGNGGHEVYKITADTLENVYEGYYDFATQTYCAGETGNWTYEPHELALSVNDADHDGFNDLTFSGQLLLTQGLTKTGVWYDREVLENGDTTRYSAEHPFKKQPLRYVFLYDKKSGHFRLSKKYSVKNPYADD